VVTAVIGETESLCPVCFIKIPAVRLEENSKVYLRKSCPDHGEYKTLLWRRYGRHFQEWSRGSIPGSGVLGSATVIDKGCPFDCGLCPDHRTSACTMVMEVTQRCNLKCPVCFASSEKSASADPDMETIRMMYGNVRNAVGICTIQLSGGEPTVRDDLPMIIAAGREAGFKHILVNTNGVRIAREQDYLKRLKEAGASAIYLQFDGVSDDVYLYTRGRALFDIKKQAVANCVRENIGVVLVPVIIPGVNNHQMGSIVQFAKDWLPTVRGIHFQPVSYIGRYPEPPRDEDRITIPDVIDALEEQSKCELKWKDFLPRHVEEAHCSFSSFYVMEKDGRLKAMSDNGRERFTGVAPDKEIAEQPSRRFMEAHWRSPANPCSCLEDDFFTRLVNYSLTITCMPFQDVWNMDLERLKNCCGHVVVPDGRILPFCSYYLTNAGGERLYPAVTAGNKESDYSKRNLSPVNGVVSETISDGAAFCLTEEEKTAQKIAPEGERHRSGCVVCGAELIYLETNRDSTCHYCGHVIATNARCVKGHFVCDACHGADAVKVIENVCLQSRETDPVALMQTIRSHSNFHIHGPEHHPLIPAVLMTALRNNGHPVTNAQIITAIQRGQSVAGGACAFLGVCGAAIGVGIAVSLLLRANPNDGETRQTAQRATQRVLGVIASYNAPRCCQRDCWLALREASAILQEHTGKSLAVNRFRCEQVSINKECVYERCPLWAGAVSNREEAVTDAFVEYRS